MKRIKIHTNSDIPYPLNILNSDRVITCNWFENPEKFGISNEVVFKVYNDHPTSYSHSPGRKLGWAFGKKQKK